MPTNLGTLNTCVSHNAPCLPVREVHHVQDALVPCGSFADEHISHPDCVHMLTDSFEDAVLANTNAGGENCHRGSALGAVMGAGVGEKAIPKHLIEGLAAYEDIKKEIDAFCDSIANAQQTAATGAAHVEL